MQALAILRSLVATLAAAALGLLLAWILFVGWVGITAAPATAQRSQQPSRSTDPLALTVPLVDQAEGIRDSITFDTDTPDSAPVAVCSDIVLASGEGSDGEGSDVVETETPLPIDIPSDPLDESSDSEAVIRLLDVADQHFERGNLTECLQRYQFLLPNTHGDQRRMVAVKLGITAENLSEFDIAAGAYSISLETHPSDELASLARLRIAAILVSQGDFTGARSHLSDWWLAGGMQSRSNYEHSAIHLLAEVQARIACGSTPEDRTINMNCLRDDSVAWPFKHDPPRVELADLEAAMVTVAATPEDHATRIEIIDQFSPSVEDTFTSVHVVARPLSGVCDAVLRKAGFTLAWSEAGYRRASARNISIDLSDVSLAVILDIITRGTGLFWLESDDGLVIASESDLNPDDLRVLDSAAARRLTQYAINTYPESERQRLTALSLANLDFHEGRLTEASHRYSQLLELSSERIWATEAAFNLGKVRLLLGDLPGSADAFLRSSDGSLGHPLQPAALLYAGRLHVCLNRFSESVPLFSRAWTMSRGGKLEPDALICLSSIYAYLGNPVGANRILVDHRDVVRDVAHYHDLAAFLGCYCRFNLARTEARRMRDARDLLDSLGNVDPHGFFSPHGWALVLRAYHELGLDQESRASLQECLLSCEVSPFRNELVRVEADGQSVQEGVARPRNSTEFEQISAMVGDETLHRMERVKTLLGEENHGELELEAARLLQEPLPSSMQIELLDMLGRSYQRSGDHYNAALCFARINPFSDRAVQLRSGYLRERVLEWGGTQR